MATSASQLSPDEQDVQLECAEDLKSQTADSLLNSDSKSRKHKRKKKHHKHKHRRRSSSASSHSSAVPSPKRHRSVSPSKGRRHVTPRERTPADDGRIRTPEMQSPLRDSESATPDDSGVGSGRTSKTDLVLAKRPDSGGTLGRPVKMRVNHIVLTVKLPTEELCWYQYHVDIMKRLPDGSLPTRIGPTEAQTKFVKREMAQRNGQIMDAVREKYSAVFRSVGCAFDRQTILVTSERLKLEDKSLLDEGVFEVEMRDIGSFVVRLRHAGDISVAHAANAVSLAVDDRRLTSVQAINMILNEKLYRRHEHFFTGRAVFSQTFAEDLGCGRVLHQGHSVSVRPMQDTWLPVKYNKQSNLTLSVNIDMSNTVFYKSQRPGRPDQKYNLIDFLEECDFDLLDDSPRNRAMIEKELKRVRVRTTGENNMKRRTFKPVGISVPPCDYMFTHSVAGGDGDDTTREISVKDYFKEAFGIRLRNGKLPTVLAKSRMAGGQSRVDAYPMELLEVCSQQQVSNDQLRDDQLAKIIRKAALLPRVRMQNIDDFIDRHRFDEDPNAADFGVNVTPKMIECEARVLPHPKMQYEGESVDVRNGVWDMTRQRFLKPTSIDTWVAVFFGLREDGRMIENLGRCMADMADQIGMRMSSRAVEIRSMPTRDIDGMMKIMDRLREKYMKDDGGKLVILGVMPKKNCEFYGQFKALGDVEFGIITQGITMQTARNCTMPGKGRQTLNNILMKINAKLGGVNVKLGRTPNSDIITDKNVLVVGADVTHPSPGGRMCSIAAVVANIDKNCTQYVAKASAQDARQETVQNLKGIMKQMLKGYYKNTRQKPEKIFYFRDGVSEGQFEMVLRDELEMGIRAACIEIEDDYNPAVTVVVVQKRHHTRGMPMNQRDADQKGNAIAGTVLDQGPVHPIQFDYFLYSHAGIQGTSRPTHYHVLHDDSRLSSDALQLFTFQLCHLYTRCTRSVSLPAPTYYAHLAAFRARDHIKGAMVLYGLDEGDVSKVQAYITTNPALAKKMYFC